MKFSISKSKVFDGKYRLSFTSSDGKKGSVVLSSKELFQLSVMSLDAIKSKVQ